MQFCYVLHFEGLRQNCKDDLILQLRSDSILTWYEKERLMPREDQTLGFMQNCTLQRAFNDKRFQKTTTDLLHPAKMTFL